MSKFITVQLEKERPKYGLMGGLPGESLSSLKKKTIPARLQKKHGCTCLSRTLYNKLDKQDQIEMYGDNTQLRI